MLWNELTFAEYVIKRATSRWYCGLALAGCILIAILAAMSGPDVQKQLLSNRTNVFSAATFISILIAIAVSAIEIPGDIISKVIYIILSKPVERRQIVVGKFLGVAGLSLVTVTLFLTVGGGVLWLKGLSPNVIFLQQAGFLYCRVILVSAMAILFSTVLSETPTIAFSVAYLVMSYATNYVRVLIDSHQVGQTTGARILFNFLYFLAPNMRFLDAPNAADIVTLGGGQEMVNNAAVAATYLSGVASWPHFFLAGVYTIFYSGLLVLIAIKLFAGRKVA